MAGYIDLGYRPGKGDLVCDFWLEPAAGMSVRRVAEYVAEESSTGTWTEVHTKKAYLGKLAAKVFDIQGNRVRIAYPVGLFECNNVPQILSSVAGNIFGMKAAENLRLNNIELPGKIIRSFKGPRFGVAGVRRLLGVKNRPLVGTIVKPKLGLRTADHAGVAYQAWIGGCDVVKDDENLSGQSFNPFRKRVVQTLKARDRAEKETGEKKVYMPNVTAETGEMMRRAEFVKEQGGRYIMVDVVTVGFSALQTLRDADLGLVMHAHRAMHGAFTKNPRHGISMAVIAKLVRLIGLDQLHIGTVVGKMFETKEEVLANIAALTQPMGGLKPVFPVCSGGLHPALVPALIRIVGKDIIIQAGGGIHGHRLGTRAGATAMRQAVDSVLEGVPIKEYSKTRKELKMALTQWG